MDPIKACSSSIALENNAVAGQAHCAVSSANKRTQRTRKLAFVFVILITSIALTTNVLKTRNGALDVVFQSSNGADDEDDRASDFGESEASADEDDRGRESAFVVDDDDFGAVKDTQERRSFLRAKRNTNDDEGDNDANANVFYKKLKLEQRRKCLEAPFPQVLGDQGKQLKSAQVATEKFQRAHGQVKDMVSENKKRWREEGSPGKEIAKTGRRMLLAYARSHPLEQRCRVEKRYRANKYQQSLKHKHLKDCMNRLEDCQNVDDARKAAKEMPGVKLLIDSAKKIACVTVSKKCNPRAMKLADNKETGMHLTGKIETMPGDLKRDYKTCALVGNGPGLRVEGVGKAIDRHEAVFRFNAYNLGPREGKMQDNNTHFAGTKQTFRMFNKKRSIIPEIWGLKPAQGETWIFWHYGSAMYYKAASAANPETYFMSVPAINHEIDAYFAIRKDVQELGIGKNFECPTNLPTGLHAIMLATMMCESVNLFGFSYDMKMLESRKDTTSPRVSPSHAWGVDTAMLRLLSLSGSLNLCTV